LAKNIQITITSLVLKAKLLLFTYIQIGQYGPILATNIQIT